MKMMIQLMQKPKHALKEGDKAPDFQLPLSNGNTFHLESVLKATPVMLNFIMGTWCPLCRRHMKNIRLWLSKLNRPVTIVIISNEKMRFIKEWQEKNMIFDLFASDPEMQVIEQFGVKLTDYNFTKPASYLIDRDQTIRMAYFQRRNQRLFETTESLLHDNRSLEHKKAS